MRKPKFETYRDIFKLFSIIDLEKTEHVLSALQEYTKMYRVESLWGIPIEKLKCTENEVKVALPVLRGIKNILFSSQEKIVDEKKNDNSGGLLQNIIMPTLEV